MKTSMQIVARLRSISSFALMFLFAAALPVAIEPARAQPAPVITATATDRIDAVTITVTGSGEARQAATLQPAASGVISDITFAAGDRVERDALLVQLDDRNERLAVAQSENRVEAARQLLARYARTRASGAVPGSVIDEARTELRTAELALAQARETLADRTVRAPFAGTLGIAAVRVGDRVTPATVLTTIDDRRILRVAFAVPERYLDRLEVSQAITVRNVAYPEQNFTGMIAQIDSRIDLATREVDVLAEVANPTDQLRPGMSFEVAITLPGQRRISVPELALQWDRDGAFVWALRDQRATRVSVNLRRRIDGSVLLDGELRAGDVVVVEGVLRLREGLEVRVVDGPGAMAPN